MFKTNWFTHSLSFVDAVAVIVPAGLITVYASDIIAVIADPGLCSCDVDDGLISATESHVGITMSVGRVR